MHEYNEIMCCVCCNSVIYATLLDWLTLSISQVSFECCKRFIYGIFSGECIISSISCMPLSFESLTVIYVFVKD